MPTARWAGLEAQTGRTIGVFAVDTGSRATVTHRADERFAMCSTAKTLAVAAILHQPDVYPLTRRVRLQSSDVVAHSPITVKHLARGMTVGELCSAALRYSDNTAANVLVRLLGGPERVTAFVRHVGDRVTRVDRVEPGLNEAAPRDQRDTSTPRALASTYRDLTLGRALGAPARARLVNWLLTNTTGAAQIRAAVPRDWKVADRSGAGGYGTSDDVAVLWPPGRAPIVLAVLTDARRADARPHPSVVAEAARVAVHALA